MNMYVFFVLLYVIPGILTAVLQYAFTHRNCEYDIYKWLKLSAFFTMSFYFVSTSIKSVTGNGWIDYSETFALASAITYIHYIIIDVVAMVVILTICRYVLRDKVEIVTDVAVSVCLSLNMIFTVFYGRMPLNIEYAFAFAIGCILGVGAALCKMGGAQSAHSKYGIKKRIRICLPICLFCVVFHYAFIPMQVFFGNIDEFRIRALNLCAILLIPLLLTLILFAIVLVCMSDAHFDFTLIAIFTITLMKYVQTVLLNGKMESMQGFSGVWSVDNARNNIIVWVVGSIAIVILSCVIRMKKTMRILCYVSVCFVAMFTITVGILALTTKPSEQIGLTSKGSLELHPKNNTIVFVLDKFDAQYFERITEETPEYARYFDDFTYYPDITSAWTYTDRAIPFLLTGEVGTAEALAKDNTRDVFARSSFMDDYAASGYSLGVYTERWNVAYEDASKFENFTAQPKLECNIGDTITTTIRMAQYASMPFALKARYSYSDMDCLIMADFADVWVYYDDTIFNDRLKNEGLSVRNDDAKGFFRFYHLIGAHEPFAMDENCEKVEYPEDEMYTSHACLSQARGCLSILNEYLRQLKELGLYDNATVIITADHGQSYTMESHKEYVAPLEVNMTCRPLTLVKMPGQKNASGKLEKNEVACTQLETTETIYESITGKKFDNRKRLDEIGVGDYSERITTFSKAAENLITVFKINGYAGNPDNWSVE